MSEIKTPSNPSRTATKRVKNPLPAPTVCPYCGGAVKCVKNSEIYNGREYGDWPWIYLCENRDAYVGLHPFTAIPLGTLANQELRNFRMAAKNAFYDWMRREGIKDRKISYPILAEKMGLENEKAHFGWFDVEQCKKVLELFDV